MIQSKAAAHAKSYFKDALAKADYYLGDQELPGFWQGKLADRLGLDGLDMKKAFYDLCENINPATGGHLTPRTKEDRKIGYDINFHCPKSVSILHGLSQDDHILTAFQDSVTEVMRNIEDDAKTRVRLDRQKAERATGELAWAQFTHLTARPLDGKPPDPHLHSHCFVFNATWDDAEQRIKAGEFRDIKRDMPFYQAQFHKVLSDKLTDLGYGIRRTDMSFEIEGVPQQVLDLFSKRTDAIGRVAKEQGITDARELDALGARTRAKKQKGHSMEELKADWLAQISELGKDGESDKMVRHAPEKDMPSLTGAQCLDHAVKHCFERASVIGDRRLLETAYRHGIGRSVSVADIAVAFREDTRLIHQSEGSRRVCTTKEVFSEEQRMVGLARQGKGKLVAAYEKAPEIALNGQQAAAVSHVLTTSDRISIIRGAAGTGKTTLMTEAVKKFEAAGKKVTVVAPTAQASRGVLKAEGFEDADTVARLIGDAKMQEKIKGQVLWVDEAGLLGNKDMMALLEFVTQHNTQLILGGDTRQHRSVVRGDALRVLNTVAGIQTAEVSKIYRQQNAEYKAAVEDLSQGHVAKAFHKLDAMKAIIEIDPNLVADRLVKDYMEALGNGKDALVICPTHAQGAEITKHIRNAMKETGLLGQKEIAVLQLVKTNLTEAEKADDRNFKDGQIVKFTQHVKGFKRGSVWTVSKTESGAVMLVNANGETKAAPLDKPDRYEVYTPQQISLSKGDKVLINANSFDRNGKRLENGDMLEVTAVKSNSLIMLRNSNGSMTYQVNQDFGHIAHAHCITSYASQGKTVKDVFIYQPAGTFPATDAKQFYVSVSRGKESVKVYTDDKEELLEYAQELGDRISAIEQFGFDKSRMQRDFVTQAMRQDKGENGQNQKTKDHEPDR